MSIRSRVLLFTALGLLAACGDAVSPDARAALRGPGSAVQAYDCQVTIAMSDVRCAPHAGDAARMNAAPLLVGSGTFVRLSASNTIFTADSMSFDVTVQNLLGQTMGTVDGITSDLAGIRVVFLEEPTWTPADPGLPSYATVGNPDGLGFFTQPQQPYFQYAGLLADRQISEPRRWRFDVQNVAGIQFRVVVFTAVQYPRGWMNLAADSWFGTAGQVDTVTATAFDAYGRPVAEPVAWSSADPTVAVVGALSDSAAEITAVSAGTTWIRAVGAFDGTRRDSVLVVVGLYPAPWLEVADSWSGAVGQVDVLTAAVFDVFGQPVQEPVVWASADPWVASVEPLSGNTARITAAGSGTTWVHAMSAADGTRRDSVFVTVSFGGEM